MHCEIISFICKQMDCIQFLLSCCGHADQPFVFLPDFNSLQSNSLPDLVKELNNIISEMRSTCSIVVMLDSIDQLRMNSTAFNLSWYDSYLLIPCLICAQIAFIAMIDTFTGILERRSEF